MILESYKFVQFLFN